MRRLRDPAGPGGPARGAVPGLRAAQGGQPEGFDTGGGLRMKRAGRPRIATAENVRVVLRELVSEGVQELTVSELVEVFMDRLGSSRRSAFRAIGKAREEGMRF